MNFIYSHKTPFTSIILMFQDRTMFVWNSKMIVESWADSKES